MKYKVKLKNIEMTKAEICFEVRPAVSILPPLDLLLFFNPPPPLTCQAWIIPDYCVCNS